MTMKAGTVGDFGGSMAQAIEGAFASELYDLKAVGLPDTGADERRLLFCAIAQGVLEYLAANPGAITATVSDGVLTLTGPVQIEVA